MQDRFTRQRAADAAAFADWSPWADLTMDPPACKGRYQAALTSCGRLIDISIPLTHPAMEIVRRLTGASRIKSVTNCAMYRVPAHEWQAVFAALPRVRAEITKWQTRR